MATRFKPRRTRRATRRSAAAQTRAFRNPFHAQIRGEAGGGGRGCGSAVFADPLGNTNRTRPPRTAPDHRDITRALKIWFARCPLVNLPEFPTDLTRSRTVLRTVFDGSARRLHAVLLTIVEMLIFSAPRRPRRDRATNATRTIEASRTETFSRFLVYLSRVASRGRFDV